MNTQYHAVPNNTKLHMLNIKQLKQRRNREFFKAVLFFCGYLLAGWGTPLLYGCNYWLGVFYAHVTTIAMFVCVMLTVYFYDDEFLYWHKRTKAEKQRLLTDKASVDQN